MTTVVQVHSPLLVAIPNAKKSMAALLSRFFQIWNYDIIGRRTESLECNERLALASQIECVLQSNLNRGGELSEELEDAVKNLNNLDEREKFIGMRVQSYRKLLERRAIVLEEARFTSCGDTFYSDDGGNCDRDRPRNAPLNHDKLKKQIEQQNQDEEDLLKVIEVQKSILVQIELCRRKVVNLKRKRDDFMEKREECLDFLVVSTAIDMNGVHSMNNLYMDEELESLDKISNTGVV